MDDCKWIKASHGENDASLATVLCIMADNPTSSLCDSHTQVGYSTDELVGNINLENVSE